VPGTGITIGINEWYCVGTRFYSGGSHTRNISGGTCPGSSASAGLIGFAGVSPALESRITRLAFSHANHRYMAKNDGRPLPQLTRLVKQGYRQLSPTQERKLRSSTLCIATDSRLGMLCGKAV
jgi:hypothetical protein